MSSRATCEPHLSSTSPSGPKVFNIPTSDWICKANLSKAAVSPRLISGESMTTAILFKATWCGCPNFSFNAAIVSEYGLVELMYESAIRQASSNLRWSTRTWYLKSSVTSLGNKFVRRASAGKIPWGPYKWIGGFLALAHGIPSPPQQLTKADKVSLGRRYAVSCAALVSVGMKAQIQPGPCQKDSLWMVGNIATVELEYRESS